MKEKFSGETKDGTCAVGQMSTDEQTVASEVEIEQVKTGKMWQLIKQVEVETEELRNSIFVLTHCGNHPIEQ